MYDNENNTNDRIELNKNETLEPKSVVEEVRYVEPERIITPIEHNEPSHIDDVRDNSVEAQVKTLGKQTTALLIGLVCLFMFLLAFSLFVTDKLQANTNATTIYKSSRPETAVALTSVDGSEELYTAAGVYKENVESVVAIQTEIVTTNLFGQRIAGAVAGSGFVISEDGYVLTNAHVVDGASSIKVKFENGDEYSASVIGKESENDVAVLKIDSDKKFKAVVLGDSDKIEVGEEIITIGNPLGQLSFSLTHGVISALNREIAVDYNTSLNMMQVDCAINEGNSGGPIFNMHGEVIGIASAKYVSERIEGICFGIPINDVDDIVTDLIEYGKVVNKPFMGISVSDISEDMVKAYNMVKGAYVYSISQGSSAEKAGLKIGDIIVELGGKTVSNKSDLLSAKRSFKAGDTTSIKVWRGGEYQTLTITFDVEEEDSEEKVLVDTPQEDTDNSNRDSNNSKEYSDEDMLNEFFRYYFGR